jgi:3-phenylpropionate/cinnamic acid dioxygenase small subunit
MEARGKETKMDDGLAGLHLHRAIEGQVHRYARACDESDWAALETIFSPDVEVDFGVELGIPLLKGANAIIDTLRSVREKCGATHHMVGNVMVVPRGENEAESSFHLRAFHRGLGIYADGTWDVMGEYRDVWRRDEKGWRIVRRHYVLRTFTGSMTSVLGP